MKFLKSLLIVALFVVSSSAMAQQKFGVVSAQEILMQMPELDSVQTELQKVEQRLISDMEASQKEYTAKIQEYQQNLDSYTKTMREQKEKDLQSMNARMQEFQGVAQQEMQEQQQILMKPIQEKLMNAIKKVGIDNNFVFVFDKASALYISETQVVDATALVKAELGIAAK